MRTRERRVRDTSQAGATEAGKKVGIRDVARMANVSLATVSRVINGRRNIDPELVRRVLDVVRVTGYERDEIAHMMRRGISRTIGIMVSDVANPLYAALIGAVEAHLRDLGYMLLVASSHTEAAREIELIRLFRQRRMDGLIAAIANEHDPQVTEAAARAGIPIVLADREIDAPIDRVLFDHRTSTRQAVEYLFSLGHQRIALLTPGGDNRSARERIGGFEDAYRLAGRKLPRGLILTQPNAMVVPVDEVKAVLARDDRPTAIISLGTRLLIGALNAVYSSHLTIPGDVSIISIGDPDFARFAVPPITTVSFEIQKSAVAAVDLLLARIRGDRAAPMRSVQVPLMLHLRQSCGPPDATSTINPAKGRR